MLKKGTKKINGLQNIKKKKNRTLIKEKNICS